MSSGGEPRALRFWQVDAFSGRRYMGNPAAIVFDADPLAAEEMQTIARQMNLSETVFLCRPSAGGDYRARIFTPTREIPFAGHPTIAAAYAYAATTDTPDSTRPFTLNQECGAGTVPVTVTEEAGQRLFTLAARAEPTVSTGLTRQQIAELLDLAVDDVAEEPAEVCSVGLPWLIARLGSLDALKRAVPDLLRIDSVCAELEATGITLYSLEAEREDCSVHVRTFAPGVGIPEDPVCGSGNAAIAVHLARHSYRTSPRFSYQAEQGLEIHRCGVLHLSAERQGEDDVLVRLGGQAIRVMAGDLWI